MKDGGPAFPFTPNPQPHNSDGTWCQNWDMGESGMTLRDYFAAKAMQTMSKNWSIPCGPCRAMDDMARTAYAMADAMLKEREK